MKKLIVVLALFICGCSSTGFNPSMERNEVVIKYHIFKTQQELNSAAKMPNNSLQGQAVYSPNDNICDVYLTTERAPKASSAFMKLLGHEVMHCLYGDFHG